MVTVMIVLLVIQSLLLKDRLERFLDFDSLRVLSIELVLVHLHEQVIVDVVVAVDAPADLLRLKYLVGLFWGWYAIIKVDILAILVILLLGRSAIRVVQISCLLVGRIYVQNGSTGDAWGIRIETALIITIQTESFGIVLITIITRLGILRPGNVIVSVSIQDTIALLIWTLMDGRMISLGGISVASFITAPLIIWLTDARDLTSI